MEVSEMGVHYCVCLIETTHASRDNTTISRSPGVLKSSGGLLVRSNPKAYYL